MTWPHRNTRIKETYYKFSCFFFSGKATVASTCLASCTYLQGFSTKIYCTKLIKIVCGRAKMNRKRRRRRRGKKLLAWLGGNRNSASAERGGERGKEPIVHM